MTHSFPTGRSSDLLAGLGHWRAATTLEVVVALVAVAVICAMTLAALVRQDMFLGVAVEPAVGRPGPVVPDVLGPTDTEAIARVESYMEEQEPFLDPSLTIRSLARRLGMGQRELSSLITQPQNGRTHCREN